ncbi:hypothetical protein CH375_22165, partial [Leptospira ellisii]
MKEGFTALYCVGETLCGKIHFPVSGDHCLAHGFLGEYRKSWEEFAGKLRGFKDFLAGETVRLSQYPREDSKPFPFLPILKTGKSRIWMRWFPKTRIRFSGLSREVRCLREVYV